MPFSGRGSTPPQTCARVRVIHADHPPPALDAGELDLVRGDETRRIGLDVDQLAPEHVLAEQHLARAALEAPEAQLLARQPHRAGLERGDPVGRHEQLTAPDPRLQAGHRRVAAVGKPHDQILDAAQPLSRSIEQRTAQDRREVHRRLRQSA